MGNFVDLMAEDPDFDIIPTVQGWRPADYETCLELYNKHGVTLTSYPLSVSAPSAATGGQGC
ncbi:MULTISPECIES: hypothetical protein [Streptomyces]|jgi:hypothetical protein|uniref:hypothetical protein n=1 Tax=Streptomyces TaxID=1883 RepID=UPI00368A0D13